MLGAVGFWLATSGRVQGSAAPRSWPSRVLIAAGLSLLLLVVLLGVRALANLLLLFFGAMVLAALLRFLGELIARATHLPLSVSVALAALGAGALLVGLGWLVWPQLAAQLSEAPQYVAEARTRVRELAAHEPWLDSLRTWLGGWPSKPSTERIVSGALGVFSTFFGLVGGIALVAFVSLYLAAAPEPYVHGVLLLVPHAKRARAREVMQHAAHTLQRWLLGRLLSMTIVAVGTAFGLWLVGVPLALSLGILAGALSFIPNLGPVLSVVPAVLVAWTVGTDEVLWVLGIYAGVQTIESFVVTPQIQERAVSVPPVLVLFAQTAMGMLTGILGVLLATPLVACLLVLVKDLYVHDVLEHGDSEPTTAGGA